jgi:hypothetical protein
LLFENTDNKMKRKFTDSEERFMQNAFAYIFRQYTEYSNINSKKSNNLVKAKGKEFK